MTAVVETSNRLPNGAWRLKLQPGDDLVVDEIAIRRALIGDRPVWEALTVAERREVLLRVLARRDAEVEECLDWARVRRDFKQKGAGVGVSVKDWLLLMSEGVGIEPRRLLDMARGVAGVR